MSAAEWRAPNNYVRVWQDRSTARLSRGAFMASNLLGMSSRTSFLAAMEAELVREGLAFATVGVYNHDVMPKPMADAPASGFTEFDLATLNEFSATQVAERQWSRAHVVHGPFADFLAAWNVDGGNAGQPYLTIVRFKRTGTYALTVGALVVATASSLHKILPTLRHTAREPAAATT
jgi:hypothetical protein